MLDLEIKQLDRRELEKTWIKNIKLLNWRLKISWIQNTVEYASSLLFFKIDFLRCRKSKFSYKNNLSSDIICLNISFMKNTWSSIVALSKNMKSFLIQHYVSSMMSRKLIIFLSLNDIALWRMRNRSINEKRENVFWRLYSLWRSEHLQRLWKLLECEKLHWRISRSKWRISSSQLSSNINVTYSFISSDKSTTWNFNSCENCLILKIMRLYSKSCVNIWIHERTKFWSSKSFQSNLFIDINGLLLIRLSTTIWCNIIVLLCSNKVKVLILKDLLHMRYMIWLQKTCWIFFSQIRLFSTFLFN